MESERERRNSAGNLDILHWIHKEKEEEEKGRAENFLLLLLLRLQEQLTYTLVDSLEAGKLLSCRRRGSSEQQADRKASKQASCRRLSPTPDVYKQICINRERVHSCTCIDTFTVRISTLLVNTLHIGGNTRLSFVYAWKTDRFFSRKNA